jgi:hypothetical protein
MVMTPRLADPGAGIAGTAVPDDSFS